MIEYRVRPVTRFVVTSYQSETLPNGKTQGSSECLGEFDNEYHANRVATALCRASTELHRSISTSEGLSVTLPPYDRQELPHAIVRAANWSKAPTRLSWGTGMMVADLELSKDETLTIFASADEIERLKSFRPQ